MASLNTAFENLYSAVVAEVRTALQTDGLLTPEVDVVLKGMKPASKNIKKEKPPKRGMNGYNLFMRENRLKVAENNPGLTPQQMTGELAKVWKEVSKEEREQYNIRAKALGASSGSESEQEPKTPVTSPKKVPEKAPDAPKKAPKKAAKKPPPAPPMELVDSEEEVEALPFGKGSESEQEPKIPVSSEKKVPEKVSDAPKKVPKKPPPPAESSDSEEELADIEEASSDIDI